jgi:outer membrane protein assembly factor BamB
MRFNRRGSWGILIFVMTFAAVITVPVRGSSQQKPPESTAPASQPGATMLFAGIRGSVVAMDRESGKEIWSTHLNGRDFVNVVLSGKDLFASTKGEIYRLEPATGNIRWHNVLKGYGRGLTTMAATGVAESQLVSVAREERGKERAEAVVPSQ